MSDDPSIEKLQAKREWYIDKGWHTNAERIREKISELEDDDSLNATEVAITDDEAELRERLEWYEEHGWELAAQDIRSQLEGNNE
jgi:hypothetical protein